MANPSRDGPDGTSKGVVCLAVANDFAPSTVLLSGEGQGTKVAACSVARGDVMGMVFSHIWTSASLNG